MTSIDISNGLALIAKWAELTHPPPVAVPASALHEFAHYMLRKLTSAVCEPNFAQARCFASRGASLSYDAYIYKRHIKNYRADTFNPKLGILWVDLYVKSFEII